MSRSKSRKYSKWAEYKPLRYKSGRGTCRCNICGQNNSDDNHIRNSYIRVGILKDECGFGPTTKKVSRKLRRKRESVIFQREIVTLT